VKWDKEVGQYVKVDDVLCVVETDKVAVDIRASKAGVLVKQVAAKGETIKVGSELAHIDSAAAPTVAASAPKAEAKPAAAQTQQPAETKKQATAQPTTITAGVPTVTSPARPNAVSSTPTRATGARTERRVKMTRMRETIARRLMESQKGSASLTTFNEIDMHAISEVRNKYKDDFEKVHGAKLGFMSIFVKAATAALQKFPDVNAYVDSNTKEIVYHDYCDVSVAVATPTGLVTPVLRSTETMSFKDIELAIKALGEKARKNQIAIEDLTGGTFTISNGGVYGSLMGTPIINPPQTAILGMHGIFKRPVVVNDQITIRPMMYVALTYDHRLIDGATAVQFLRTIKNTVEDPSRLLLDLT
jgi:2-oxoglutarate dehydrogenase E2 component (dihydrolipoamide succinyltransferase)